MGDDSESILPINETEVKLQRLEEYFVYVLQSEDPKHKSKVYIGYTVDMNHRLRQHNNELVGGARYTKRYGPWRVKAICKGFRTNIEALEFEWVHMYSYVV
jgi:predicted GIY-YIG superfamily endonuclease